MTRVDWSPSQDDVNQNLIPILESRFRWIRLDSVATASLDTLSLLSEVISSFETHSFLSKLADEHLMGSLLGTMEKLASMR